MPKDKNTKKKFKLIPPKSGVEEYKSIYDPSLTFVLKIFDFEEDDHYSSMILNYMEIDEDGNIKRDKDNNPLIKGDEYYLDVFEYGIAEVKGLDSEEYQPSWKVIKEIVNKISQLNSVKQRKK